MKAQTDTELERIKAIVAMLLAFARLADRVSHTPHPARSFVLWLLRRTETVVREWLDGPAAARAGKDPAHALGLAASLRALACAVEELVAQYRRFGRRRRRDDAGEADGARRRAPDGFHHAGLVRRLSPLGFLAAAPYPDTS